jgi:MFS family permease
MRAKPHPMIEGLKGLRGNPRICVFTEPLWGVPYNLYLPFVSMYMLALGLSDPQIGLIASIGLFCQIFWSLASGPITDKLGRRMTTFVFDVISWSLPVLIWAFARNFTWFVAAAVLNSVLRVTMNSWSLLLVEDAPRGKLVTIWSWVNIAGIVSGFFSPLAGLLVARFSLITAVRILYLNAFVFMTAKFVILFFMGTETEPGRERMAQTAGKPFFSLFGGYSGSIKKLLGSRYTLLAFFISLMLLINDTVRGSFWPIMVVEQLHLPKSSIAFFPFPRAALMLVFYFLIIPRMNQFRLKRPFLWGFSLILASNVALVLSPERSWIFVAMSALFDAAAVALISPYISTLMVDAVERKDRAGIMAIINVLTLALASPFGWIAGLMSSRSRYLPFFMLMGTAVAGLILTLSISRHKESFSEE